MTAERAAYNILLKVTKEDAYANLALKDELSYARTDSFGRSTALVYTAIERMKFCDRLISFYAKGRLHSSVRCILRLALTEMFFMDAPDHAVCSRYVSLTGSIGKPQLKGYVNGILRSIARDRDAGKLPPLPEDFIERTELLTGYPSFMIEEYVSKLGEEETEKLLLARVKGVTVRPVWPHTPDEIAQHLNEAGVSFCESELVPGAFRIDSFSGDIREDELFRKGAMTVQSEGAMLACRCLGAEKGSRVLDACAAPGGKTAYVFDLMERCGSVTAWDIHPHRAGLIEATLKRLGIEGVKIAVRDASQYDASLASSFDAVLCDVPCSGLGGGSKPDARLRRTSESIEGLAELQYSILSACSLYVKPEGRLVYSTCTLSERENEGVIRRFLADHAGFKLESLSPYLPEKLKTRGETGLLALMPHIDDTDGFFIAALKRIS